MENLFGEIISRAQAIEDGILVDMTEYTPPLLKQAGFRIPVAVTRAVYDRLVILPDNYIGSQSIAGRFSNILRCLAAAVKRSNSDYTELMFTVRSRRVNNNGSDGRLELVKLKAVIGPGDTPESVFTFLFPEED